MELKKPRAVLFDWDNTLVDTWPVIHEALNTTFTQMGKAPWPLEMVKQRVARSMRDSFPDIFGLDWHKAGEMYQSHFRAIHLERLTALSGSETVLSFLRAQPIFMGIVSNKKGINLRKEVTHIRWDKYFDKVIGADDTPRDKPYPEPVIEVLKGSGIEPGEDVWFVGDSIVDMEVAHVTGCIPIWYGEPLTKPEFPPVATFTNHAAFLQVLAKVFSA